VAELAECSNNRWENIFIEAMILLYPMLELIGHARLGLGGSNASLYAGIEWLRDGGNIPAVQDDSSVIMSDHRAIQALASSPSMRDIFSIRQYFLHGLKSPATARSLENSSMEDILNYRLPDELIVLAAEDA
jgi:hypothetical protein